MRADALFEDGFETYHAGLRTKVRVKAGIVAGVHDSRGIEKLTRVNLAGQAYVCCSQCYLRGERSATYSKMLYRNGAIKALPQGHPWKTLGFFRPATRGSPTARHPHLYNTSHYLCLRVECVGRDATKHSFSHS